MHFENLQLPSPVIAELYKQSLVVLQDVQPQTKNGSAPASLTVSKSAAENATIAVVENVAENIVTKPTLAESEKNKPDLVTATAIPIKYLGGYHKQVAIVIAEHFSPNIGDDDLEFLSKLLTACKLSLNDVAIINVATNPQHNQLWALMQPKVMLMFDVDPGTLGLAFRRPHFEVQEWSGSTFMTAPELSGFRIGNEQDIKMLKTKLWLCLQKIFLTPANVSNAGA